MPRRVSLPGASELFRTTHDSDKEAPGLAAVPVAAEPAKPAEPVEPATVDDAAKGRGSGRVRHDEKITVYVSSDELLALERARLTLRAEFGMAVDRGRIVREAISALLVDLEQNQSGSELVRRLSQP